MLGITVMLGITDMLVWFCMSLTSHTCSPTCTQHVALLCRGVFTRQGAVSSATECGVLLVLPCLNVTAAGISCSVQCLYTSSALDTLGVQLPAELLRVTEDSNIVKL